jgi:hypothetical protein
LILEESRRIYFYVIMQRSCKSEIFHVCLHVKTKGKKGYTVSTKKSSQTTASQPVVIANPLYDTVFKYLMENERVAKFFISTLLDETVLSVDFKSPTTSSQRLVKTKLTVRILQLDFVATIQTSTGEHKKVLVELQKSNHQADIARFREYLSSQYRSQEVVNGKRETLPITTIYILGFNLPEIKTACIKVEREYKDLINRVSLTEKSSFVEKLTHDSYVVQVKRITKRYRTRLDKLLSIFEQDNFLDQDEKYKAYLHPADNDIGLKEARDRLAYCASDAKMRRRIENEYRVMLTLNDFVGMKDRLLEEKEQIIEKQGKALEEKEKILEEKEAALEEKNKKIEVLEKKLEQLKR